MSLSAAFRLRRSGGEDQEEALKVAYIAQGGREEVTLQGEGHSKTRVNDDDGFFSDISVSSLAIIGACAVATALICVVALVWFRARRRRHKLMHSLQFDLDDSRTIKSAPGSRLPSPRATKRMSCPNVLASARDPRQNAKSLVACSMTTDRIPDFQLPPERVQPDCPRDPSGRVFSFSASQQNHCMGTIRPDLYHSASFSDDEESHLPESTHGRLWYSLLYDVTVGQLQVTLVKVKDLPGRADNTQTRDPFVKMFLLPDERSSKVSKVKKKTLSPVYNETHTFQVGQDDIRSRVLRFSVYDVDKRRIRHSLGHVMVNLKSVELTSNEPVWSDLEPMVQAASSLGELQLSLAYYPHNDRVKVGLHRARNLQGIDQDSETSTYVKLQLYYGHKNVRTKRTTTRPCTLEHRVNESVGFTVGGRQLNQCSLVVSLVMTSPPAYGSCEEEYGRVVVGPFMYARGEELVHWQEMIAHPKIVSTRWHTLVRPGASSH